MAEAKAVFAFDVQTGQMVDGTNTAIKALTTLKATIEQEKNSLKELESQMKLLQSSSQVDIKEFRTLKQTIEDKRATIQKSSESYVKLGGKLSDIGKATKKTANDVKPLGHSVAELGSKVSGLPGPLSTAGGSLSQFAAFLSNPYVAVIALGVAVAAAGVALFGFGLASADAARRNRILITAMAGSDAAGASLQKKIKELTHDLPLASEEVQALAKGLTEKGLNGSALEHSLAAVARTTAVLGSGSSAKLDAIITKSKDLKRFTAQALDFTGSGIALDDVANALAKRTGRTMQQARESIKAGAVDLATGLAALDDATKTKLGASADQLNLSFSSIGKRAKEGLGSIFSGLKIEPILTALSGIVDLLDESSASGKALRAVAEVAFQPLIDFIGGQGQGVVGFIKGLIIYALRFAIMVLQAKNALKAFAEDPIGSLKALGEKLVSLGSDLINGLVEGIKNGAAAVSEALGNVVDGAISKAKEKLGIKSPSKVFEKFGVQTMQGYVQGVDREAPKVESSLAGAIPIPQTSTASTAPVNRNGPTIGSVVINISGDAGGIDYEKIRRSVISVLEDAVRASSGQAVTA